MRPVGFRWSLSTACFAATLVALPLRGQVLPGSSPESRGSIHARFMDAVMEGIRETATEWSHAWATNDFEALAEFYREEAHIVTPEGVERVGREEIRTYLEEAVLRVKRIETFLVDADASNDMAMTVERYQLHPASAREPVQDGLVFTVFLQENRTWRIRSQLFRPSESGG